MSIIAEKYLDDYPRPIYTEGIEKVLRQMRKSIVKICTKSGTKGTGFFCKAPILNANKFVNTFMTNYHVIEEEKEIEIKINNGMFVKKLNLKNNIKYSNKNQDIVIFKIKEELNDLIEYLELDNNVLDNNNINYIGNSIYTIHYPSNLEEDKVGVSFGILKQFFLDYDKIFDFMHFCSTERGSSGSPIFNLSNNRIIGIHKETSTKNNYNIGLFLSDSVKAFIKIYLDSKKRLNNAIFHKAIFHNINQNKIDSKIVKYDDINFIQKRLMDINPRIKKVSFSLVYRASEDGDRASDFHRKCDKIGPNIVFIKTRKGVIFGGFTFKNWEHLARDNDANRPNLGSASRDFNSFGFNVNKKKLYNNEKPKEFAIWCNKNFGPTFKNNLFQIFDRSLEKGGYCNIRKQSNFGGQLYDYEISGGDSKFKIEDLEVFLVEFK